MRYVLAMLVAALFVATPAFAQDAQPEKKPEDEVTKEVRKIIDDGIKRIEEESEEVEEAKSDELFNELRKMIEDILKKIDDGNIDDIEEGEIVEEEVHETENGVVKVKIIRIVKKSESTEPEESNKQ